MTESGRCRVNRYVLFLFLLNLVLVMSIFYYCNGNVMRKFDELRVGRYKNVVRSRTFAGSRPGQKAVVEQAPAFKPTPEIELKRMSLLELYTMYMSIINSTTYNCGHRVRYGNVNDGGWEVCQDGMYQLHPRCLVYSMGINWEFSFDDSISSTAGCKVHAFDPSMKSKSFNRSNLVEFHNYGLKGEVVNTAEKQFVSQTGFQLKNFDEILTSLKHKEKTIDYFKMDIEGPEWKSMDFMLKRKLMSHVKQFAWEIHIFSWEFNKEKFISAIQTLQQLRAAGFEMYLSHQNPMGFYDNPTLKQKISCCYETYYVNTRYRPGNDDDIND